MSYPTTEWLNRFGWTMNVPIPAGTIINSNGLTFEILEDTQAHGRTLVKNVETSEVRAMTLYLHTALAEAVCQPMSGACPLSLAVADKFKG